MEPRIFGGNSGKISTEFVFSKNEFGLFLRRRPTIFFFEILLMFSFYSSHLYIELEVLCIIKLNNCTCVRSTWIPTIPIFINGLQLPKEQHRSTILCNWLADSNSSVNSILKSKAQKQAFGHTRNKDLNGK